MDPDSVDDLTGRVPHGGEPDTTRLDFSANVNPRTPAGVTEVYEDALDAARSYPAEDHPAFRRAGAKSVDCEPDKVVPSAGGMAALRLAIATTVRPGAEVLLPTPSFGEYEREVRLQGGEPTFVHYADLPERDPASAALCLCCNPNNPTGDAYDPAVLRRFATRCHESGTPLLVDEAFHDFTTQNSLAGTPGTIVIRSLTKMYGLPGLRAGFAVATGRELDRLSVARKPWNLGTPAAAVGVHCLERDAFVRETRERVRSERKRMTERLRTRFSVHPSDAPFLLLECIDESVDSLLTRLDGVGIAVRDARTFAGLDAHIRVAVRTREENEQLLEALDV